MKSLLILFCLVLTACGAGETLYVDPELQAAVDFYLAHAPDAGHWKDLDAVQFGTLSDASRQGDCERPANKKSKVFSPSRRVTIRADFKNTDSPNYLRYVVAHELAHCLHDKPHSDDGLMSAQPFGTEDFWRDNLGDEIEKVFL